MYMFLKEGNSLFNDALNTFYLRLYGIGHDNNNFKKFQSLLYNKNNPCQRVKTWIVYIRGVNLGQLLPVRS